MDRDIIGYGASPPNPNWPGGARLAVNFVLNFEEGSEPQIGDGDPASEWALTEYGAANPNMRRLLVEEGGFLYDSDAYDDELPYWTRVEGKPHLVVPYTLGANDSKFGRDAFATGDDFFTYCRDAFDFLYREGATQPKMMSIGMHMRILGHPARASALERLLDHIHSHQGVWVTRRLDIARHWL